MTTSSSKPDNITSSKPIGEAARKPKFNCRQLEEFCKQLRYTPPDKRLEQLHYAENLHDEIDPKVNYPLDYIKYRITRWRLDSDETSLLVGEAILPDLRQIIDTLSKSLNLRMTNSDQLETVETLADRLHVSTKTINRWRKLGLRWRWASGPLGGRKQVVFTRKAVELFTNNHPKRVTRAGLFTQIPKTDRDRIIRRARRIVQAKNVSFNQVCQHLAKKMNRAVETIRLILEKYDEQHPGDAIFNERNGRLTTKQKKIIDRAYQRNVPIEKIMQRFKRSRSSIYRTIYEQHAAEALRYPVSYIPSNTFNRKEADEIYLRNDVMIEAMAKSTESHAITHDLPKSLHQLYHQHVIAPHNQQSLFLRYNYVKFVAAGLQIKMLKGDIRAADLNRFDSLMEHAGELKSLLTRANLPLVLSIARRHITGKNQHERTILISLLEQGNQVLIESIESYDASRAQLFESYLSNRLMRAYANISLERSQTRTTARRRSEEQEQIDRIMATEIEHGKTFIHLLQEIPTS